jgi:hypothetical protein
VRLALGSTARFRGVEHVIRASDTARSPVWIDRDAEHPTIRVAGGSEHTTRRLVDWLKREARRKISERVAGYSAMLGVTPRRITIRDTSSRWGSCSSTRSLSFSWRLIRTTTGARLRGRAWGRAFARAQSGRVWRLVETLISMSKRHRLAFRQWRAATPRRNQIS